MVTAQFFRPPRPLLIYSTAHDSAMQSGTRTLPPVGTHERVVARTCAIGIRDVCDLEDVELIDLRGEPGTNWAQAMGAWDKAHTEGRHAVVLEVHMNSTGLVTHDGCPRCANTGVLAEKSLDGKAVPCQDGRRIMGDRWSGMLAQYPSGLIGCAELAADICHQVAPRVPPGRSLGQVAMPDPSYLAWAFLKHMGKRASLLVESGFAEDPIFCAWIDKLENQAALGRMVAEVVCAWLKR